ncbi:MAG: discoidin domain-containing protein [Butyricicoccus pullicaecorum]|nr:discoidin domain-containing protein [Butyricicoccus pullicaecorum]
MNHNFYKKAICLLLASSVTFGPAVGPLSAHALEELSTQMADQMAELTPAQSSSSVPMMELTLAQSTESETPDDEKTEDAVEKEEKPQDSAQQDEQSKLPEQESPVFTGKNLAQEQEVQVSASHTAQGSDAEHARDGESGSAWTAEAKDGQVSLSYDLQGLCALEGVQVQWESADTIKEYFIETSVNGTAWDVQAHHTSTQKEERIPFQKEVEAQHVRLCIVTTENNSAVGVQEFAVYGKSAVLAPVQPTAALPAGTNLARQEGVTATESNVEAGTDFNADKARDGDRTSKSSRWATDQNVENPTITYDLGQTRTIGGVVIYWEQSSASHYFIETSTDGNKWDVQKELKKKTENLVEKIDFDNAVQARHIRVRVEEYSSTSWNNVAMYEFEVYQEKPSTIKDASSVAESINPREQDGKLVYDTTDGFDITVAANYEQVIGQDGTIYQPLVDMNVDLDVEVVNQQDPKDTAVRTVPFKVKGQHTENEGNEKPAVIPELTEWYSTADQQGKTFALTESSRIVCTDAALESVAQELQKDIQALFDFQPEIVSDGAQAGDIVLSLESDLPGFDKETYQMTVTEQVELKATDKVGIYWGTRSVLQALMLSGDARTIAQGTARDYPEFKLRGFLMDVGRKPFSMDMLQEVVKNMSWFKLNDFHVHLSDNLIFMEDYVDSTDEEGWPNKAWEAYSGYRLEYTPGEDGKTPASKDYHYSKQEFRDFVDESAALGINIVPELDVPAHALPLTQTFPETALIKGQNKRPWIDHIDISKQENIDFVKTVYDNYLDDNTFAPESTVHIGADEFYDSHDAYRTFVKQMIAYMKDKNRTLRIWGSLTQMNSDTIEVTPEEADGVQMNIWNTGWANPQQMYKNGFDLINTVDGALYMVPNGKGNKGGYGDYLNAKNLYETWTPNNMGGTIIPAGSDQMLGAAFAIWQDNIDTRAAGIDEVDTFVRFYDALVPLSVKMWGEAGELDRTFEEMKQDAETIGMAPNSNPLFEVENKQGTTETVRYDFDGVQDSSGNGRDLTLHNAEIRESGLHLNGGESYAEVGGGLDKLGWDTELTFRVKKSAGGPDEQILFEADHAYDEYTIKAIQDKDYPSRWKLGFSRELYDYVFDIDLPMEEWVTLTLHNTDGNTTLSVNGSEPVSAVGSFLSDASSNTRFIGKTGITHSSFVMPIARIGSKTNAFVGQIDDVSVRNADNGIDLSQSDKYDVPRSEMTATAGSVQPNDGEANLAIDGDPETMWHTKWGESCTDENAWLELKLDQPTEINALRYLPRKQGVNGIIKGYKIQVKENETDPWTDVAAGTWSTSPDWKIATFDAVTAQYVRLIGLETLSDSETKFVSAAEVRVCKPIDLTNGTDIKLPQTSYPLVNGQATPKPIVKLKDNGAELREGRDYTLSYENHTAAGTGTVIITGTGRCKGEVRTTYDITDSGRHSVVFHIDGDRTETVQIPDGGWVTEPEEPSKTGYTFQGWYTDFDCKTPYEFGTPVKSNLDLYASWRERRPNGGSDKPDKKPEEKPEEKPTEQDKPETGITPVAPIAPTVPANPETIKPFTDVSGHWGQDAIAWAVTNHLFSGVSEKSFAPDTAMTRGMLVTVLHRLSGTPTPAGSNAFTDVPANSYFEKAVAWASHINLVLGVGESKFAPNANITREQLAVTLYKFAGQPKSSGNASAGFQDGAQVSDWAKSAMDWALQEGLIQGAGAGSLAPKQQATRAQVAAILMRFEQLLKK